MRVIVTGWRQGGDPEHQQIILNALHGAMDGRLVFEMTLVHGDASGVDRAAAKLATDMHWTVEAHPARWEECGDGCPPRPHLLRRRDGQTYCPYAGPRRNEVMCRLGADLLLAFPGPGSRGTWDCVRRAAAHGIPTHVYPLQAVEQKAGA